MVTISFPDRDTEKRALAFLLGRFSGRVLRSGEHLVPEAALEALADQNISFTVQGSSMPTPAKPPTAKQLRAFLGDAFPLWSSIVRTVEEACSPLDSVWKPSKTEFGQSCRLQYKKRTLIYLIPEQERIEVAIVLGERAYQLAMASTLPEAIKTLFSEARPYVEGRGIRFPVHSDDDLPAIAKLIEIKTTPP